mmetsp:Transcript_855/g.3298  ORF Transcript_855/g.3298 Transcript_855/m.3298 type:complete len:229 (-) Transcript_855:40-726(-)
MLRHAGIAAGDALARNAARATDARSVSMLCVPDPRSPTTRGRGPPSRLEFFCPSAHPHGRGRRPNLARPPRISLALTADPNRPPPSSRPQDANSRRQRMATQVPQGQARRRGRVRQQVLREHELPVGSSSMGRVRGPGQLQRDHRALRVARLAVSRGRRARAGDAHGAKVPGEVHRGRAHHRRSGGDVPAQGELLQQAGDAELEEVHPVVPALSSSRVFFYSHSTLRK